MSVIKGLKNIFGYLKQNYLRSIVGATWLPLLWLFTGSLNYLGLESCKAVSNFNLISAALFLTLFIVIACVSFFYFIVGSINKANRSKYWAISIVCSLGFILCVPTIRLSYMIRMAAMGKSATLANPIIDAIEEYKIKTGNYPKALEDLIPNYISNIPHTGMCAYPHYEYRKAEQSDKSGGYELFISTSIGLLNWDEFIYRPSGVYGESFERVGRWAYYHE